GRKRNFTHSKSDEAKRHDNHAPKEQQQRSHAPRKNKLHTVYRQPKEQAFEERKTNQPGAT
ncbi:hypothetical protein, partial [Microcystis sp. M017S1]|uniref:hypothetical protein n=1 Tax=Microcystis sp. M017S1 TaxID=2771107 RepID=UPI0025899AD1